MSMSWECGSTSLSPLWDNQRLPLFVVYVTYLFNKYKFIIDERHVHGSGPPPPPELGGF
jgi:hypothetical protein